MTSERLLREENRDLYEAIFPVVSSLPDFRPPETTRQMKVESQDNWKVIEDEIAAASRTGGEEDLTLIQAIFSGDLDRIEPFLEGDLDDFFFTYQALIWLASKVAPEETIIPLLVSQNIADLLPESFDIAEAIQWIRDRKMARYLYNRNPNAIENKYLIIEWTSRGELGKVLWALEDERVNPSVQDNLLIRIAVYKGNVDVVRELMKDKRVDPSDRDNEAIRDAASDGYLDVIKTLLKDKRVDPSAWENHAIRRAAEYGHLEVVRELLKDKRVGPTDFENHAIEVAAENGHLEIVRELLKDERVRGNENTKQQLQALNITIE